MRVVLFVAFFGYSLLFIGLVSYFYNVNLHGMFDGYQSNLLTDHAYRLMDDMRNADIASTPLSDETKQWLQRRASLSAVVMQFADASGEELWLDMFDNIGELKLSEPVELPYLYEGRLIGHVRVAYTGVNNDLSPVVIEYEKKLKIRSQLLLFIVVVLSLFISLFIAKLLSSPLSRLNEKAHQIRMGRHNLSIEQSGPEEVRRLAASLDEMNRELKKQEDWRQHLMEDLTHELRTPLASTLSHVEAMIDGVYDMSREQLEEIYEELDRLSRLVNDLERLSEAESARFAIKFVRTDMIRIGKRVYHNFDSLARNKGIRMRFESSYVPCYGEVDSDKIMQVYSNVVSNAIKYTPSGGHIVLGIHWTAEYTVFTCKDDGIGITREDLPYIFNRLYRADKSRSRFSGGVGLGLSIARALVEAHNGTIEAESEPGVGSTFTIYLPNKFGQRQ
ncbi:ATP-binding protein [Paenibacillus sp. J5C_2022]|uniref:sensor histidine kinase n=1 Tax=Paenibacillus sp. J5C2022 TaxID=2977129 RepID=UPI0021D0D5AB|nr:ATP-binding protein [Paenibacillus sp. J5C2022]MCU6710200.1 ATP-binding protein [Paenibacillus sp. J5C2022]